MRHFFSGFMHAHISYLAEDCQACLVLLTIDHDLFFVLSDAKKKITEVCYVHIIFNLYLFNLQQLDKIVMNSKWFYLHRKCVGMIVFKQSMRQLFVSH